MAGTQNSSLNLNLQNARWDICDKLKRQDILKYSMTKKDVAILNHTISRFILMSAYVPTTN